MIAIGGWGDTEGFSDAAATESSRQLFAQNVKAMVDDTGADGVDIDWEYPGGNGEDYKQIPNTEKAWEIEAYPLLLATLRSALPPNKIISAAVPGLPRDMLAFTRTTAPTLAASLDFLNVMTYDLMNRRDNTTAHHTGIAASLTAITTYRDLGIPAHKLTLGFAFYIKWYRTSPPDHLSCAHNPLGCPTAPLEDPTTGADLARAGAFSWHDPVPAPLALSYAKAIAHGTFDPTGGGHYYWDPAEDLWWSWDTEDVIAWKFPGLVERERLGGVFAWGLGEDADAWVHLRAVTEGWRRVRSGRDGGRGEL